MKMEMVRSRWKQVKDASTKKMKTRSFPWKIIEYLHGLKRHFCARDSTCRTKIPPRNRVINDINVITAWEECSVHSVLVTEQRQNDLWRRATRTVEEPGLVTFRISSSSAPPWWNSHRINLSPNDSTLLCLRSPWSTIHSYHSFRRSAPREPKYWRIRKFPRNNY